MKKLIVWSNANPFLAFLGAGAIITGVVFLIRAIMNANKNGNENPQPDVNPDVAPPTTRTYMTNSPTGRIGWSVGSGRTASSAGMSGARVVHGKS